MKLYITDSTTGNEIEDSDDITITDTSTDNNTWPVYIHQICQQNENLKQVNKTKKKLQKELIEEMIFQ